MFNKQRERLISILILAFTGFIIYSSILFTGCEGSPQVSQDKQLIEKNENAKNDSEKAKTVVPIDESIDKKANNEYYKIYFSQLYDGNHKLASENPNSIDRKLAQVIRSAKKQIYAALHELDSKIITDALLEAHRNKVEVKIVTEDSYNQEESILQLKKEGIPIVDDANAAAGNRLMHNKFIVIDGEWVWTGSFNTTYNGSYKNDNNAILIHSKELAENYLDEFKEMFFDKSFGIKSPKSIKYGLIRFSDGTTIKTLFAPENKVANALISEINKAKQSIYFLAFSFTHNKMGDAMIKKHLNAVKIMGVFEKRQNSKHSEYHRMIEAGIQTIKTDDNKYNMHHKVIIIDERITITGSFNFSNNADKKNDENVLIIDSPRIAKIYLNEFNRIYGTKVQ
ncbi:MAG: phospholipase D-like domain-containing protein [Spirochaetota bacterium]|nr:phospholipase D-like domain-containing protein [Spirochaetota bacterium]